MTAFHVMLESTEWLAQQPVHAPVTALLVAFRQPVLHSALIVTRESIPTWLEAMSALIVPRVVTAR